MGRLIDADEVSKYVIIGNGDLKKCPTVEAIPKDQYEARLKADMVAMLTDIQLEIEEQSLTHSEDNILSEWGLGYNHSVERCGEIIQQKIDALKEVVEDGSDTNS